MKDCNDIAACGGRRDFLIKATVGAGGLMLTLSGLRSALAGSRFLDDDEITIAIDDMSPLNKVGGSQVISSKVGKIIILRTGNASFVAFSAKCTHKGGLIEYDDDAHNFLCPKHGSRFDKSTGNVVEGPADNPLPAYTAKGSATSVTVGLTAKT